ncbi:hypothetical protein KCTC52924_01985 [Arenibacter antarcticus]|uniref:IS66 family insertion sequence element accessory protein TnpB n=1 Tax=Arenibacter antarcticus TaxID=2040469 RepID=A0ABW5VE81_9FLAO|nr:IS66 family insertion sequence element accessory protein TnpB [Arenibacter sp. H213]MCM4168413.1 IS66 family insertion sequence hypothetical protein [Arenibacter sp. H213]
MSKEQEMFALIGEFESSPLNGRDFCKAKGLLPSTFYYWKKKRAEEVGAIGFVEIDSDPVPDGILELIYPNGTRIRLSTSQIPLIGKLLRLY